MYTVTCSWTSYIMTVPTRHIPIGKKSCGNCDASHWKSCHVSCERQVLDFYGNQSAFHSAVWWERGRTSHWPPDSPCLTSILVLARGQEWVAAIISVDVRKSEGGKTDSWRPAVLFLPLLTSDQMKRSYALKGNTCLLCWPVVAATNHSSEERLRGLKQQLTSTARLPGEQLLSHQCVGDHVQNMQNTAFWAVLESQISPKPTLSQKQPSWSMRINTFCLNISKAEVKFCINAMLCKQKTSNRVKICSYLWTLSPHTHLLFFTTLPCFYLCIPNPPPPPSGEFPPPSTPPFLLQTTAIIPNACQTSYWT